MRQGGLSTSVLFQNCFSCSRLYFHKNFWISWSISTKKKKSQDSHWDCVEYCRDIWGRTGTLTVMSLLTYKPDSAHLSLSLSLSVLGFWCNSIWRFFRLFYVAKYIAVNKDGYFSTSVSFSCPLYGLESLVCGFEVLFCCWSWEKHLTFFIVKCDTEEVSSYFSWLSFFSWMISVDITEFCLHLFGQSYDAALLICWRRELQCGTFPC